MPLGPEIEELLTGYLDDQLSDDERRVIESAMQQDSSVSVRLEELRELSQSLRLLGQQTVSGLSADFTNQLLARCRESVPKAKPVRPRSYNLRIASAMAAVAATVFLAVWLPQALREEQPIAPLADTSNLEPAFADQSIELRPSVPDSNQIASDTLDPGLAEESERTDRQNAGHLASQNPVSSEISYILVLDLEITEVASKQDVIRSLFYKYGINLTAGVTVNSDIEKAVERMRFSVVENQPSKAAELFLVRAPATILDGAVSELEAEVDLVPGYRFDLAFQSPTVSLSQAIMDSLGEQVAANNPLAIPVVADLETAQTARVDSIPLQGTYISTSRRLERFDSVVEEMVAGSDLSYLLILVRRQ